MADFWAGVAQGFGPAHEASSRRREKKSDLAEAAVDRIIEEYTVGTTQFFISQQFGVEVDE